MKIAYQQPFFFPYLGYFELIYRTGLFVVADIEQYVRRTWMNRNRILHPGKNGWQYVNVPVRKQTLGTRIVDIHVFDKDKALERILGQIHHYKKNARYFKQVVQVIKEGFYGSRTDSLSDLNTANLDAVCTYLGIAFDHVHVSFSELESELWQDKTPVEKIVNICRLFGIQDYLNLAAGRDLYDPAEFAEKGVDFHFLEMPDLVYDCSPYIFEANLSIIDVMMWNSRKDIISYLKGRC